MAVVIACVAISLVVVAILARRGVQEPRNRMCSSFAEYTRKDG